MANEKDIAVVTRDFHDGELMWGFKCSRGFAPFGPDLEDKKIAEIAAEDYDNGDDRWIFVPLEGEVQEVFYSDNNCSCDEVAIPMWLIWLVVLGFLALVWSQI